MKVFQKIFRIVVNFFKNHWSLVLKVLGQWTELITFLGDLWIFRPIVKFSYSDEFLSFPHSNVVFNYLWSGYNVSFVQNNREDNRSCRYSIGDALKTATGNVRLLEGGKTFKKT